MKATPRFMLLTAALLTSAASLAWAQQPNFSPAVYGDGQLWGTKGTTTLPAPKAHNQQSFDKLFVFVGQIGSGQLPVSEAAPGNPLYNGGRWFTHTVMWTGDGMAAHNPLPTLKSYDDIMLHYNLGHLAIQPGSPSSTPPDYFQCPLLPVK